ncbi:aldo/keto reductase [Pullulanibacillus sp. KACC 23026]|uniref:aldo/keto reductase n=1 Tax=Pullulanibacillus sp. KACC 23026 TaxID=3028315 RepID=UPI0023AF879D|nr:aldo/keto reductase [Pullulanibacillus sp. KACC 23026]WEG11466.1 aldo/keto reductase [Pullulanibacillus sp. KACC 23026]
MKKHQLGTSDLVISEIGFGTMSLPQDEKEAIRLVHEAIDQGINFFDTADLYDQGRIESVLGKAIKGKRDDLVIATKVGNHWEQGKDGWYWDPSKAYIKEAVKGSLQRLGIDAIDLYQLHGGTLDDPIDETIEAFEELKQEGLIRYYGISSIRPNVIREYVKRSNLVSVMMQYSLLDRRPEEAVLDLLHEHHISVIARGPVAKGLLSEKGLDKIPANGYLSHSPDELQKTIEQLLEHVKPRDLSQVALRYVIDHPAVATAIPGASRLSQLLDNAKAAQLEPLNQAERDSLRQLTPALFYDQHR